MALSATSIFARAAACKARIAGRVTALGARTMAASSDAHGAMPGQRYAEQRPLLFPDQIVPDYEAEAELYTAKTAKPSTASAARLVPAETLRSMFSDAMSRMYRSEVPLYGDLVDLVTTVNKQALEADPALKAQLQRSGELSRLNMERHGAIRVGTAHELSTLRRLFAVFGLHPVGYYDLSVAGVPVHSTAFRPTDQTSLLGAPFRVFCSLLRLELIDDPALREQASDILARRNIFTPALLRLIETAEASKGQLTAEEAVQFIREAIETFRWHGEATVDIDIYRALSASHKLTADVVSFKGPHINHLTPRTLDIDAAQAAMIARKMQAKTVIEGPPRRKCPILLRQTSFVALQEAVSFPSSATGVLVPGTHSARFGEIEQRGCALTPKGRALYDVCLHTARQDEGGAGSTAADYAAKLETAFKGFPDDWYEMRRQGLGYFRYSLTAAGQADPKRAASFVAKHPEQAVEAGLVQADPIEYEDFLPVSAAGIFQSNLGGGEQRAYGSKSNRDAFEAALGASVADPNALYEAIEKSSLKALRNLA